MPVLHHRLRASDPHAPSRQRNSRGHGRSSSSTGGDGYRTAANIVGPDEADKLLADLVARNMRTVPDDKRVRNVVAEVRNQKGF